MENFAKNLHDKDPLAKSLIGKWNFTPPKMAFIVFFGYLAVFSIVNLGITASYQGEYIPITNPDELATVMITFLIYLPIMWGFYIWQNTILPKTFKHLEKNHVIGNSRDLKKWNSVEECLIELVAAPANSRFTYYFPLIGSAVGVILYYMQVVGNSGTVLWYAVYDWFFYGIYLPQYFLASFVVLRIFIRQVVIIKGINDVLQGYEVVVHPLHSDQAGGFKPLGTFAVNSGFIAILTFVFLTSLPLTSLLVGQAAEVSFRLGIGMVAYLILGPTILFGPTMYIRREMMAYKEQELSRVAELYNQLLRKSQSELGNPKKVDIKKIQTSNDTLESLTRRFEIMQKMLPTSPISLPQIKNITLTSLFSFIPSATLGLIDFLSLTMN